MLTTVVQFPQRLAARWQGESGSSAPRFAVRRLLVGDWGRFSRSLIMIPVFPLLGYYGLDQTGASDFLVRHGLMARQILGEGFGHVGLCFSLHYVVNAGRYFYKACRSVDGQ